jgi:hypothetical protein
MHAAVKDSAVDFHLTLLNPCPVIVRQLQKLYVFFSRVRVEMREFAITDVQ